MWHGLGLHIFNSPNNPKHHSHELRFTPGQTVSGRQKASFTTLKTASVQEQLLWRAETEEMGLQLQKLQVGFRNRSVIFTRFSNVLLHVFSLRTQRMQPLLGRGNYFLLKLWWDIWAEWRTPLFTSLLPVCLILADY